jgi:molecular chaperone GrpE
MTQPAEKDTDTRSAPATDHSFESAVDPEASTVLREEGLRGPTANGQKTIEALEQALAVALAKAEDSRNQHLRAVAELENVRKRAQRDIENAHRYGLEKFAQELLAVKDTLERGLEAGDKADAKSLLAGKEATLKLLNSAFEKFNLTEINPVGAPFDPQLHEALSMQESRTAEPNSVLRVIQKGHQLNGRLLRPARVIVTKAPGDA